MMIRSTKHNVNSSRCPGNYTNKKEEIAGKTEKEAIKPVTVRLTETKKTLADARGIPIKRGGV